MTFSSKESCFFFLLFFLGFLFFIFFLQSSFAELRPLDFGIRTIGQSNVLVSEVKLDL